MTGAADAPELIAPTLPLPISDYAMLGDLRSAALVGTNGAIDWLCWPRFDSDAILAAILGTSDHGSWRIAPLADATVTRHYVGESLILETLFETATGVIALIDLMAIGTPAPTLIRRVECRQGQVEVRSHLKLRFGFGASTPWVERLSDGTNGIRAIAGPDLVVLRSTVPTVGVGHATVAQFTLTAGEHAELVMSWGPSHEPPPAVVNVSDVIAATTAYWAAFAARCTYTGPWRPVVMRSLLTLKALTYAATGGIVAAPTTSLPEALGGVRNWDYRFCWLRDSGLTLLALMLAGYVEEAQAWRDWLLRSVAGNPEEVQIMYGISGERRLEEWEATWLPGYHGARPVRIGNAAAKQVQLDVFGNVVQTLHMARKTALDQPMRAWGMQRRLMEHLERIWREPDRGIWEVRGAARHMTHSKIMAWVAFDRSIQDAEAYGLAAPLERWRAVRDEIHREVCARGYDAARNTFTQSYGAPELDAVLLTIPHTGFLPIDDPRITGTIAAIEQDLVIDGLVHRYLVHEADDGVPGEENAFLACSFWLVDVYLLQGRKAEGDALFARLVGLANDVGLLAEEYDSRAGILLGNMPQAFSHLALVASVLSPSIISPRGC